MRLFNRNAFTMMELLLTLTVVSAVGMMVVPMLTRQSEKAAAQITLDSMATLRRVIVNDYSNDLFESLPYPADPSRIQHPQLKFLYDNPLAFMASNPDSIEATSMWTHDMVSGRGWSGPYIDHASGVRVHYQIDSAAGFTNAYGETGDPVPVDAWGQPIVLQQPVVAAGVASATSRNYARLVSAGEDGILQTPLSVLEPNANQTGDDLVIYLRGRG